MRQRQFKRREASPLALAQVLASDDAPVIVDPRAFRTVHRAKEKAPPRRLVLPADQRSRSELPSDEWYPHDSEHFVMQTTRSQHGRLVELTEAAAWTIPMGEYVVRASPPGCALSYDVYEVTGVRQVPEFASGEAVPVLDFRDVYSGVARVSAPSGVCVIAKDER